MTNRERAEQVIGFKVSDELDDVSLNILTISIERALDEAEKRGRDQIISEKIVNLCVCVNGKNPLPDCPCVICTVKRSQGEYKRGQRDMRERAAAILPKFGQLQDERLLKLATGIAELIRALPIEGE